MTGTRRTSAWPRRGGSWRDSKAWDPQHQQLQRLQVALAPDPMQAGRPGLVQGLATGLVVPLQ